MNKEEFKKEWFQENKERIYKQRKEYLQNNPEALARKREYQREWHRKYRTKGVSYKTKEQERGKARMFEYKNFLGGKCSKCSYAKNYGALEFHHIGKKTFTMSGGAAKSFSKARIYQELKQCVLLCANCHREHHCPQLVIH